MVRNWQLLVRVMVTFLLSASISFGMIGADNRASAEADGLDGVFKSLGLARLRPHDFQSALVLMHQVADHFSSYTEQEVLTLSRIQADESEIDASHIEVKGRNSHFWEIDFDRRYMRVSHVEIMAPNGSKISVYFSMPSGNLYEAAVTYSGGNRHLEFAFDSAGRHRVAYSLVGEEWPKMRVQGEVKAWDEFGNEIFSVNVERPQDPLAFRKHLLSTLSDKQLAAMNLTMTQRLEVSAAFQGRIPPGIRQAFLLMAGELERFGSCTPDDPPMPPSGFDVVGTESVTEGRTTTIKMRWVTPLDDKPIQVSFDADTGRLKSLQIDRKELRIEQRPSSEVAGMRIKKESSRFSLVSAELGRFTPRFGFEATGNGVPDMEVLGWFIVWSTQGDILFQKQYQKAVPVNEVLAEIDAALSTAEKEMLNWLGQDEVKQFGLGS